MAFCLVCGAVATWRVGESSGSSGLCDKCREHESRRDLKVFPIPSHAIITPFPVSNLMTWCGYSLNSSRIKKELVAATPKAVTCVYCIQAMKQAKKNLDEWVPELVGGE